LSVIKPTKEQTADALRVIKPTKEQAALALGQPGAANQQAALAPSRLRPAKEQPTLAPNQHRAANERASAGLIVFATTNEQTLRVSSVVVATFALAIPGKFSYLECISNLACIFFDVFPCVVA
jgi:hypothetical protein